MASTNRIPFIDIAKGIMIILLIFHHLPQVSKTLLGLENETLESLDGLKYIYCTFFMQAFFVITGYCSNFDKKIQEVFDGRCTNYSFARILVYDSYKICYNIHA